MEGEDLPVAGMTGGAARFQDLAGFGANTFSNDAQVWWTQNQPGDRLTLEFPVDASRDYLVQAAMVQAIDYGIFRLYVDGVETGPPLDLYVPSGVHSTGPTTLCFRPLTAGAHTLEVEVAGRNADATGTMFGLDYLKLLPASSIGEWALY